MTTCARCGARSKTPWKCDNATECGLRAELRDLRAAVVSIADRIEEHTGPAGLSWARELRAAVKS